MDPLLTSSGENFDSAGFDDFMNASNQSDEDQAFRAPTKKQDPGKSRFTDFQLPASSGDPYGFNIDLTNIKAPKPSDFKKKPVVKPEPKAPAKPDAAPVFSQFSNMLNMMKDFRPYESESEISDDTYKSAAQSSDHFEEVDDRPSLKVVNWSDVKDQLAESESFPEIKTEVFRTDTGPKISLSKKFQDDASISVSGSYPAHPIKEESEVAEDSTPQESVPEEEDYESDFITESEAIESLRSSPYVSSSGHLRSPYAYGSIDIRASGSSSGDYKGGHPRNMLDLIKPQRADDIKPTSPETREPPKPAELKPSTPLTLAPKSTDQQLRELTPESAHEMFILRQRLNVLEKQLEERQTQIYEYEREQITKNFTRIEENAIEKLKLQLRDAHHKIDLYKIETEELIKQVDFSEAKVRDLEVENDALKVDLDRKAKFAEERMRRSEVLGEERTKIEARKEAQRLTDELSSQLDAALHELDFAKERADKAESECRELRLRLRTVKEQDANLDDLKHENYALQSKLKQGEPKPPQGSEWQKEIEVQENLIRGYQKENERLVDEVKSLKMQLSEDQRAMYAENRRLEGLRDKLIKDHGGVLIKENVSDISSINELAGGTVINRGEFLALKERAAKLDRELREVKEVQREREQELMKEIERLWKAKLELEGQSGTATFSTGYRLDEVAQQHDRELKALKASHEEQLSALQSKLAWYVENQELLERKDAELKDLKAEVTRLQALQAPQPANSAKVATLEKQVKALEAALKQKDPNSLSAMIRATKNTPETNATIKGLQEKVKRLETELRDKEVESENMVRSLRQEYEKLRVKLQMPQQAWLPGSESKPVAKAEVQPPLLIDEAGEHRLAKAEQRVRELEAQLLNRDHSIKVSNLQSELNLHLATLEKLRTDNEQLRLDKQRLETHIERTPQAVGTSELVALQRKIETIEDNHYRRERELKNRMESLAMSRESEFEAYKKKCDNDKASLQRILANKNKEVQEIRGELELLLKEIDEMRS